MRPIYLREDQKQIVDRLKDDDPFIAFLKRWGIVVRKSFAEIYADSNQYNVRDNRSIRGNVRDSRFNQLVEECATGIPGLIQQWHYTPNSFL